MEFIIIICVVAYALYCGIDSVRRQQTGARASRQRESAAATVRRRHHAAEENRRRRRLRRLNGLARNMQLALLQLDKAPDFRRAANFAAHAKQVPIAFRQRQFQRFRGQLVQHLITRLQAGSDPEVLLDSLGALLTALGVSEFEADYILEEAERRRPPRREPPQPDFGEELLRSQREHEARMTAIRGLAIESAIREQMLEAESTRFERMMVRGGDDSGLDDADFAL